MTTDHVTLLCLFSLCCDYVVIVLRLIVLLNWVLFCIYIFILKEIESCCVLGCARPHPVTAVVHSPCSVIFGGPLSDRRFQAVVLASISLIVVVFTNREAPKAV